MYIEKQTKDTPSQMFRQTGKGTQQFRFEDNRESAARQGKLMQRVLVKPMIGNENFNNSVIQCFTVQNDKVFLKHKDTLLAYYEVSDYKDIETKVLKEVSDEFPKAASFYDNGRFVRVDLGCQTGSTTVCVFMEWKTNDYVIYHCGETSDPTPHGAINNNAQYWNAPNIIEQLKERGYVTEAIKPKPVEENPVPESLDFSKIDFSKKDSNENITKAQNSNKKKKKKVLLSW